MRAPRLRFETVHGSHRSPIAEFLRTESHVSRKSRPASAPAAIWPPSIDLGAHERKDSAVPLMLSVAPDRRLTLWAAWLFCGSLLAASLDGVPDPPATRQRTIQFRCAGLSDQVELLPTRGRILSFADIQWTAPCAAFEEISATHILKRTALVSKAADRSPPDAS